MFQSILAFFFLLLHLSIATPDGENPPSTRGSDNKPTSSSGEFCSTSGIYFKQLLAGVDFATNGKTTFQKQAFRFAKQMQNYVYLVGDRETGETVVIDGCWDPKGINKIARKDEMKIVGFVATHFHWDHVGGKVDHEPFKSMGVDLPGLKDFVMGSKKKRKKNKNNGKPVRQAWISEIELQKASERTGVPASALTPLIDGSVIDIGNRLRLTLRHTPGHSPGSMVVLVSDRSSGDRGDHGDRGEQNNEDEPLFMISGDTLFPGSCGRVDLPESNAKIMWDSLQIVGSYDNELVIFPGHAYSGSNTTIRKEKKQGLLGMSRKQWMQGR